jgi:hypothetical protein
MIVRVVDVRPEVIEMTPLVPLEVSGLQKCVVDTRLVARA